MVVTNGTGGPRLRSDELFRLEELHSRRRNAENFGQVDPNIRGNYELQERRIYLRPAKTKLAILNPREEVEEIQDEIDEPLRCSADCCQC